MKNVVFFSLLICLIACLLMVNCKREIKNKNIPNTNEIYSNIQYLDSLSRSRETDSIQQVNDRINTLTGAYRNNIQSAMDKLIIDSLLLINSSVQEYIRFCTDIQLNLQTLKQDTKDLEDQYSSGKIKLIDYINQLYVTEESLIDISDEMYTLHDNAIRLLFRYNYLSGNLGSPSTEYLNNQ